MIRFENISMVQILSKQEYIDLVISKIFVSINQSIQIVNDINAKMKEAGENDFDVSLFGFGVNLAIDEAINNALIHGNCRDPKKIINITYAISTDHLKLTVEDEGEGFDVSAIPIEAGLNPNQGRGIILMRNFMDKVVYNAKGNKVTMYKYRRTGGTGVKC